MNHKKISLCCLLLVAGLTVFSQTRISSPYSRYGLGDLYLKASSRNQAMGGFIIADYSPGYINFRNPASYTSVDSLSFLFDAALRSEFSSLSTLSQSQSNRYASLEYLTALFPLNRRLAASAGLIPYSNVGYRIKHSHSDPLVGNTLFTSEGSGGLNAFYVGMGVKIAPWLSVGANASYIFGGISKTRWLSFPDSSFYFNIKENNTLNARDILVSGGLIATPKLGKYRLNIGITGDIPTALRINADSIALSYMEANDVSEIMDTLYKVSNAKGSLNLPLSLGFGISLQNEKKWLIGADLSWQKWTDYASNGVSDTLINSLRLSVGGEFTPNNINYRLNTSYFRRITYRVGAHYGNSYLEFGGKPLDEYGISFGLGLPLRGTANRLNLTSAYTLRGSTENGLLKQSIFHLSIGVSINERWFVKPRID